MLLTVLLAALELTQAAAAAPTATAPSPAARGFGSDKDCRRPELQMTKDALRPRRFGELSATARLELAVIREIDGCPIPAVLNEGVGRRADAEFRAAPLSRVRPVRRAPSAAPARAPPRRRADG